MEKHVLEEILQDEVKRSNASNQPMFDTILDYEGLTKNRLIALEEWKSLSEQERAQFNDQSHFERDRGVLDSKSASFIAAKNFSILSREVKERISQESGLRPLPLEGIDFDDSVLELAESIENAPDIRDLYRLRKKTTGTGKGSGISSDEAIRMKNCFTQGRELYMAGKNGSLMVKPLNFFYALTAYAYGVVVLNNPLRYNKGNLPGSHGMSYLPDTIQARFGGDSARGTFSDLFTAFPTQLISNKSLEINVDCTDSILEFYENRFDVSVGTLLSMIPEMSEYYKLSTGLNSRCYPLDIVSVNNLRSLQWQFQIGDGENRPSIESINQSFSGFEQIERHGKIIVTVPVTESHRIKACIYTDIRGNFWFIDNPFFPIILPEICLHFLITNIYSSIMRYRPDEWGNVLLNQVSSDISLLTRHYFSSFQRKFFIIILRSLSRYLPYAA